MHVNLSPLGASISMLQDAISTQSFTIESHKINGFTHSCNGILNEPIGAIQQSAIQLKRNLTFRSCTPHPAHWAARVYISVEVGAARGDTMCLWPVPFHVVYWCTKLFMINDLGILNYSPNCTVRHLYRSLTQSPLSASVRPNDFSLPHVWCVCVCVCLQLWIRSTTDDGEWHARMLQQLWLVRVCVWGRTKRKWFGGKHAIAGRINTTSLFSN